VSAEAATLFAALELFGFLSILDAFDATLFDVLSFLAIFHSFNKITLSINPPRTTRSDLPIGMES